VDKVGRVLAGEDVTLRLARGVVRMKAAGLDPHVVSDHMRRRLGVEVADGGGRMAVVTHVARGAIADRIGLRPGDAILQLGSREVRGASDFAAALGDLRPDRDTVMLVGRGQFTYYVTLSL
jgi:S1-C subfamily serine protease